MTSNVVEIHLKRQKGRLNIQTYGRGPRGQRYLIRSVPLDSKMTSDESFKGELASKTAEALV